MSGFFLGYQIWAKIDLKKADIYYPVWGKPKITNFRKILYLKLIKELKKLPKTHTGLCQGSAPKPYALLGAKCGNRAQMNKRKCY